MLHLVRSTLVTALAGAQEVGAEVGTAALAAVRGAIRAAASIGADLGGVAREAIRGNGDRRGGDRRRLGVARSAAAARSRPPVTSAVTSPSSRGGQSRAA